MNAKEAAELLRHQAKKASPHLWPEQCEEIAAMLEGQPRWIPVGEQLPEEGVFVLVVVTGDVDTAFHLDGTWQQLAAIFKPRAVTHWQPLPAPPAPATAKGGAE